MRVRYRFGILIFLVIFSLLVIVGCSTSIDNVSPNDNNKLDKKDSIEIIWGISHKPEEYFLDMANQFKQVVERETNGEITVKVITKIYPGKEEFNGRYTAVEAILEGKVDMMQVYTSRLANINSIVNVLDTPGLFRDYEHADLVLDGDIGKNLLAGLENDKLKGLAFTFSGGFMSFVSSNPEIKELSDLKGKTLMGFSSKVNNMTYEQLGLIPIQTYEFKGADSSVSEYLDNNMIDIVEANYDDLEKLIKNGYVKSILPTHHRVLTTAIMINRELWNQMDSKQQKIVTEAVIEAARDERVGIKNGADRISSTRKYSNVVHDLSISDKKRINEASDLVQIKVKSMLNNGLVDEIKNMN